MKAGGQPEKDLCCGNKSTCDKSDQSCSKKQHTVTEVFVFPARVSFRFVKRLFCCIFNLSAVSFSTHFYSPSLLSLIMLQICHSTPLTSLSSLLRHPSHYLCLFMLLSATCVELSHSLLYYKHKKSLYLCKGEPATFLLSIKHVVTRL